MKFGAGYLAVFAVLLGFAAGPSIGLLVATAVILVVIGVVINAEV